MRVGENDGGKGRKERRKEKGFMRKKKQTQGTGRDGDQDERKEKGGRKSRKGDSKCGRKDQEHVEGRRREGS